MTSTVASSANSWGPFCKQIVSTLRHAWYQEMHSHQEISQFSHIPVFLKTALAHWPCDIPSLRPHIRHWHRLHGHCGRRNPLRRSLQAAGTHLSTHGATGADATLIQALGAHHGSWRLGPCGSHVTLATHAAEVRIVCQQTLAGLTNARRHQMWSVGWRPQPSLAALCWQWHTTRNRFRPCRWRGYQIGYHFGAPRTTASAEHGIFFKFFSTEATLHRRHCRGCRHSRCCRNCGNCRDWVLVCFWRFPAQQPQALAIRHGHRPRGPTPAGAEDGPQ